MPSSDNDSNHNKYARDIKTIKDLPLKVEEKSIFETWVFFAYGFILISGAIANYLIAAFLQVPIKDIFLKLWIPLLIIMGIMEPIALVRKMTRESLPVFPKTVMKLYLGIIGSSAAEAFLIFIICRSGNYNLLPYFVLCFWAIGYLFYAQIVSSSIFVHAVCLIIISILLFITNVSLDIQIIAIASILGISCTIIGITDRVKSKKNNEK